MRSEQTSTANSEYQIIRIIEQATELNKTLIDASDELDKIMIKLFKLEDNLCCDRKKKCDEDQDASSGT